MEIREHKNTVVSIKLIMSRNTSGGVLGHWTWQISTSNKYTKITNMTKVYMLDNDLIRNMIFV